MRLAVLVLAVALVASAAQAQGKSAMSVSYVAVSTADAWRRADAVVRLRIDETTHWDKGQSAALGGLSVQHTATVISVLKAHTVGGPADTTVTFVQAGSAAEPPVEKGAEFIAFLRWSTSQSMFMPLSGRQSLYLVREGQVTWVNVRDLTVANPGEPLPPERETLTVEDFIARLRALAKDSGPSGGGTRWKCPVQPVEPCAKRHGRLSSQNGIALTIWITGTTRVVAVENDFMDLPPLVRKYLDMTSRDHSHIFGDFDICPVEPDKPGHMRLVCVAGAEKLVVQPHRTDKPPFRLLSTWPKPEAERPKLP